MAYIMESFGSPSGVGDEEREPRMRSVRWSGIGLAAALLASCSSTPIVSNTGYQGTWSRGSDQITSTIALVVRNDEAWFRWNRRSADGNLVVRCGWEGHCEEFQGAEKISEFEFRAWLEPTNGRMRIAGRHKLLDQKAEIRWIDELEVIEGGTALRVVTLERDGTVFDRDHPTYEFRKAADVVTDPPAGLTGGTQALSRAVVP